jgi:hypothetical protein
VEHYVPFDPLYVNKMNLKIFVYNRFFTFL